MKLPNVPSVPKKLVPARTPAVLTKLAPSVFPESTAPSGGGSLSDPDDESTFFTFFMTLYLGMFGLTLLIWPSVHSQDGPFTNPMAYWTSMSDTMEMIFRLFGGALLVIVLGPYMDELFGGVGVRMKAFTEQVLLLNIFLFFIFLYYTFYAPLSGTVSSMWTAQCYLNSVILAWNIGELLDAKKFMEVYAIFNAALYCFFGISLAVAPSLFFGPPSPVAYWKQWGELDLLTGRSLGFTLLALAGMGYYYMPLGSFCNQIFIFNLFNMYLFIIPAFYGGASAVSSMWEIQVALQVAIVCTSLYLEATGVTGGWKCKGPNVSCSPGLSVNGMNLFNFLFFFPFFAGFMYDANALFGPTGMMSDMIGMGMFTKPLGETALWFGKAWSVAALMIVLGPYLFDCGPVKVVKQMATVYLTSAALFAYAILNYSIFSLPLMYGLGGMNVLCGILCVVVAMPASSGEAMF